MSDTPNITTRRFNETESFIRRFVGFPDDHSYVVSALWAMHTHVRDSSGDYAPTYTPRLAFLSDGPASGKTVALATIERLSHGGQRVVSPTALGIVNMINKELLTPFIDEIDELFGTTSASKKDLRAILNAGYERGGSITRASGVSTVFGPIAFAGMGANFTTADSLRALRSRTIAIHMRPHNGELEVYRRRTDDILAQFVRDDLESWGRLCGMDIAIADPEMPAGVSGRDRDIWSPLLAIGDLAGDEVALRTHAAVAAFARDEITDTELSFTDRLIIALHEIFQGAESLATATIVDRLRDSHPQWATIWPDRIRAARGIASALAAYSVRPVKLRLGERTVQGYTLASLLPHLTHDLTRPAEDRTEDLPLL